MKETAYERWNNPMTEKEVLKKIIDRFDENIDDLAFTVEMLSKILNNLKKVIEYMEDK